MIKFIKKTHLSVIILFSLLLGVLFGYLMLNIGAEIVVKHWVTPFGTIFLNLLKLIAVPIVFLSVVTGIFNLGSISEFKGIAGKAILFFVLTTLVSINIGLFLVSTIKPGEIVNEEHIISEQTIDNNFDENTTNYQQIKDRGPLSLLVDIVPENIFKAATDNSKMLQIIFFAFLLGVVILIIPEENTKTVKLFFSELSLVFIKLVDIIMKFAPIGVFALMSAMIVEFGGEIDILKALGLYAFTVVVGLLIVTYILYFLGIYFFTNKSPIKFYKAIFPAQLVAFTTSSSAATLPVTKRQVENELKISPKISGFVLPLGMTINMDGTSLYQAVAVVFISQVLGIDLNFSQIMLIILLTLLSSIGAPGIPGGSIVMLVAILTSVGIPAESIILILGVDRPLDMLRTVTNVTGDSFVCCLLGKNKKEINDSKT